MPKSQHDRQETITQAKAESLAARRPALAPKYPKYTGTIRNQKFRPPKKMLAPRKLEH